MSDENILIAGSGMAAWGAFSQLQAEGRTARVVDKKPYPGGHTASHEHNGFVFDEGPHISFTDNDRVRNMLAEAVGGEFETLRADVDNYYQGHLIVHPAIVNLYGLPEELVASCIEDFVAVLDADDTSPANYKEWLLSTYGTTFTETFPSVYGRKYHTVDPSLMDTSWLGPRLYRADLRDVLLGALAPPKKKFHYVDTFRYPSRGGFAGFLQPFFDAAKPELGKEIVAVEPGAKTVTFRDGEVAGYDRLISSVPLPELIKMMPAPPEVSEAAAKLACSTCVVVSIGVDREDLSAAHWRYIYDEDITSVRINFPHMFSPHVVPPGTGAVQVEVYYSDKYKPLDHSPDEDIQRVIHDLIAMNVLTPEDTILHADALLVKYANVIFDLDSGPCTTIVHDYLDEVGVDYCGRYGEWAYIWTDESFTSGERAAVRALERS